MIKYIIITMILILITDEIKIKIIPEKQTPMIVST